MAVDIVPRKATGAALGVVGMTSYIAAGIQDVASGWLIDSNITVAADGVKHYDFGPVAIFWLAAAVISFLLPLLNRGKVSFRKPGTDSKKNVAGPLPATFFRLCGADRFIGRRPVFPAPQAGR